MSALSEKRAAELRGILDELGMEAPPGQSKPALISIIVNAVSNDDIAHEDLGELLKLGAGAFARAPAPASGWHVCLLEGLVLRVLPDCMRMVVLRYVGHSQCDSVSASVPDGSQPANAAELNRPLDRSSIACTLELRRSRWRFGRSAAVLIFARILVWMGNFAANLPLQARIWASSILIGMMR